MILHLLRTIAGIALFVAATPLLLVGGLLVVGGGSLALAAGWCFERPKYRRREV